MTAPDFAAVTAAAQLDARVPALCQTCNGKGTVPGPADLPFTCPDCPTIGKLLAIGAAVMACPADEPFAEWREHLRILRAVQP